MPRPGPRPYECIRRAWHSDSHQPLRGTLIREIFRVVNELHSTSTRRKKEWQEKLPIVVLRAEEILYSKANSEGEYADVETLRSRLNDAVNTMIRREDGEEEGVYLVPCIEAALSLGCVPKKASRGQRQGSSRHLPNAARRVSPAARPGANEQCIIGTMTSTDPVRITHERHSNSTFSLGTQFPAVQEQDFRSIPHERHSSSTFSLMGTQFSAVQEQDFHSIPHATNSSLLSSAGAFWVPSTCYPPNASFTPPQNPSFCKSLDVPHPVRPSSFPRPGALVQFLRATDTCKCSVFPQPEALYVTPQTHFNVNQELRPLQLLDSAESSGARMSSRFFCRDVGVGSSGGPPSCTKSSLSQNMSRDDYIAADHQNKLSLAAQSSSRDSASHNVVQNSFDRGVNSQLKEFSSVLASGGGHGTPMPKAGMSLLPNWCKSGTALSLQRNGSEALSGIDDTSASLSGAHDLQLRLGPPVNKPTATPVSTVDASAPKRMKGDVHDPSAIQIV